MEIYLDHEYNGAMVVYSEAEAAEWAKKGWLKRPSKNTPEKLLAPLGLEVGDDGELREVGGDAEAPKKKPGRKKAE